MLYARKFLLMLGGVIMAALLALVPALDNGAVDAGEWLNVVGLTATAAGVFAAPNIPGAAYTKTVLAVIGAIVVLPVSYFTGSFTAVEGVQLAIAVLAALGVNKASNVGDMYDLSR